MTDMMVDIGKLYNISGTTSLHSLAERWGTQDIFDIEGHRLHESHLSYMVGDSELPCPEDKAIIAQHKYIRDNIALLCDEGYTILSERFSSLNFNYIHEHYWNAIADYASHFSDQMVFVYESGDVRKLLPMLADWWKVPLRKVVYLEHAEYPPVVSRLTSQLDSRATHKPATTEAYYKYGFPYIVFATALRRANVSIRYATYSESPTIPPQRWAFIGLASRACGFISMTYHMVDKTVGWV